MERVFEHAFEHFIKKQFRYGIQELYDQRTQTPQRVDIATSWGGGKI